MQFHIENILTSKCLKQTYKERLLDRLNCSPLMFFSRMLVMLIGLSKFVLRLQGTASGVLIVVRFIGFFVDSILKEMKKHESHIQIS